MANPQAPRRGPGAPRALSSRDRCWAADPGALARPLPRRRLRRTGDSLTGGRRLPPPSARPRRPDRGPGTEQAAAGHRHDPSQSHGHLRRPEVAGPLLLGGVGHRADPGSRHGHPRPGGRSVLPRQARAGATPASRAAQRDVAIRSHHARHPGGGHRRQARTAMADNDPRRLLPGGLRLHSLPGRTVGDEHRPGAAPSDLAQDRPGLADVRPARRALRRPRQRLHQ